MGRDKRPGSGTGRPFGRMRPLGYGGRPMGTQFEYFAACAPGLEALLLAELHALGLPARAVVGGVTGRTDWPGLWTLHLDSALAESVRLRLKSFHATSFAALEAGLGRLPWHAFLWRGQALDVRVVCHESKLYHSDAVAERVRRVLGERLARGKTADGSVEAARVHLRLSRDVVTPSIDSSGELLHHRGYRTHVEKAPLRETLAAAMVQLLEGLCVRSGQSPGRVWDPFSGSGVLPLEWLRRAHGRPPGAERGFAFEGWPAHQREAYQRHRSERLASRRRTTDAHAFGSDVDAKAVRSALANAERSGLAEHATFWQADFRAGERVPEGAAMLSNPPYGKRIGDARLARRRFRELAELLERRRDLRPVVLACPERGLLPERQGWEVLARTRHGGLPLEFVGLS